MFVGYGDIESYYSWVASEIVTTVRISARNSIINRWFSRAVGQENGSVERFSRSVNIIIITVAIKHLYYNGAMTSKCMFKSP